MEQNDISRRAFLKAAAVAACIPTALSFSACSSTKLEIVGLNEDSFSSSYNTRTHTFYGITIFRRHFEASFDCKWTNGTGKGISHEDLNELYSVKATMSEIDSSIVLYEAEECEFWNIRKNEEDKEGYGYDEKVPNGESVICELNVKFEVDHKPVTPIFVEIVVSDSQSNKEVAKCSVEIDRYFDISNLPPK